MAPMIKQRIVSQPNKRMLDWSQANCKLNSVDNICKHWVVIDNNKIAYFISTNREPNDHQCNQTVTHALRYFCTYIHTWMPLIWLFNSFYVDAVFLAVVVIMVVFVVIINNRVAFGKKTNPVQICWRPLSMHAKS